MKSGAGAELYLYPGVAADSDIPFEKPDSNFIGMKYVPRNYGDYTANWVVDAFNISFLKSFFPNLNTLDGTLRSHGELAVNENRLNYFGELRVDSLIIDNASIDSIEGIVRGGEDYLYLERARVKKGPSSLEASGSFPAHLFPGDYRETAFDDPFQSDFRLDDFRIETLSEIIPSLRGLSGRIDGRLSFSGILREPLINGRIVASGISVPEEISIVKAAIDSVNLTVENSAYSLDMLGKRHGNLIKVHSNGLLETWNRFSTNGSIEVLKSRPIEWNAHIAPDDMRLSVSADSFRLDGISSLLEKPLPLSGILELSTAMEYRPDSLMIFNELDLKNARFYGILIDSLESRVSFANDKLEINRFSIFNDAGTIDIAGGFEPPKKTDSTEHTLSEFFIDMNRFPLTVIDTASGIAFSQGILDGEVLLENFEDDPILDGYVALQNDTVRIIGIREPLVISDLVTVFDGQSIRLEKLNGSLGGGTYSAGGSVLLKEMNPENYQFQISAQKISFSIPDVLRMHLEKGNLGVRMNNGETQVSGEFQVGETRYIEDIKVLQLLEKSRRVITPPGQKNWAERIRTKLHVYSGDNLWIDNNVAKLQANADIGIDGILANPRVSGRINAVGGRVGYLGKQFEVRSGSIDFINPTRIDPVIDLTAEYNTSVSQTQQDIYSESASVEQNYVITIRLRGPLSNLQPIQLSSNPPLPQQDIITLVTLGRKSGHLLSGPQTQGGTNFQTQMLQSLALLSSAQIAGYTESFSKNLLKLDKVSLQGNVFGMSEETGPILTVEKQVAPRLRLTYSTSVGNYYLRRINLEYQIYKFLYLETQTDERGDSGADLKLIKRFK